MKLSMYGMDAAAQGAIRPHAPRREHAATWRRMVLLPAMFGPVSSTIEFRATELRTVVGLRGGVRQPLH